MDTNTVNYSAFISYRHKEFDSAAAKSVQRHIENYRVPKYLSGKTHIKRLGKVFRDRDELPLLSDLGKA